MEFLLICAALQSIAVVLLFCFPVEIDEIEGIRAFIPLMQEVMQQQQMLLWEAFNKDGRHEDA